MKPVANRYRFVSHVHLGENCGQGVAAVRRSLVDPKWDKTMTYTHINDSLLCVATLCAIYKT